MKKNIVIAITAIALAICCGLGVTLAWLMDKTEAVTNTFTYGNVDITLTENTGKEYKMIPGKTLDKDPTVTVEAGSEACWLFVTVTEANDLTDYIDYTVDSEWTELEDGVYYIKVDADTAKTGASYSVLSGDEVTVKGTVTKAMMDALEKGTVEEPTLTFMAYAIQSEGFATAADAWAEINK